MFCDDIRHEVTGKMTLVGCYQADMNFNGAAPGILPTFAALVNIRVPISIEFKTLTLRVIKETGDEAVEIFKSDASISDEDRLKALGRQDGSSDETLVASLSIPIQWSLLEFSQAGTLKVRAYLDGKNEIHAGRLKVGFLPQDAEVAEPSST